MVDAISRMNSILFCTLFLYFFLINKYFQVLFKRVAILDGSDGGESCSNRRKRRSSFGVASFVTVTKSKINFT